MNRDSNVEQQFATVYAEHFQRLVRWLQWRLPSHRHTAEDLAQEAFQVFWAELGKGFEVGPAVFGFLKFLAKHEIATYFAIQSRDAKVQAVDVTAPEEAVAEALVRCRYAAGDPELALLAAELETAMERMRAASAQWRALHAEVNRCRGRSQGAPGPEATAKWAGKAEEVAFQRDEALLELQESCRVVGTLRRELEQAGGNWRSSCDWPPAVCTDGRHRKGYVASDLSMTHCPDGHRMELENVTFSEDGARRCRPCIRESAERNAKGSTTRKKRTPRLRAEAAS